MRLKVVLVAEEGAGAKTLRLLLDRGHRVAAVFTRGHRVGQAASVAGCAKSLGVPLRASGDVRNPATADWLRQEAVDLLLNVHSLDIIDAQVLAAPPLGAYNLHPGPLPERAGLHVPSWAIYEGADRHGVTLHRMTPELDRGDIAFADYFRIGVADTGLSVMLQCVRRGMRLIEQLLDTAERGARIPALPQDLACRRWFSAGPPQDGRLDWHRPARSIANFVRACDYRPFPSPWGFPRCTADGRDVAILSARTVQGSATAVPGIVAHAGEGAVLVATTDSWVRVDKVVVDRQAVAPANVIRHGIRLQ